MPDTPTRHRAPGAGRPRKAGKRYQVRLTLELAEELKALGGGEITAGIVRMADQWRVFARALGQLTGSLPDGTYKVREERMNDKYYSVILTDEEMKRLDDGQGWYKPGDDVRLGGYGKKNTTMLDLNVNGETVCDNWMQYSELPHSIKRRMS